MVQIPSNDVTLEDMILWNQMKEQLEKLRASEMLLRLKIFGAKFPTPVEGTNSLPLSAGYVLKGVRKIDRKLDEPEFANETFLEGCMSRNFNPNKLVKRKPELVLSEYRQLTEEQRGFFDSALIIKDGSPSLEIVLPKSKQKDAPVY